MSAVWLTLLASVALSQADAGQPEVAPVPANTDQTASDVVRQSGLEATDAGPSESLGQPSELPASGADGGAPTEATAAAPTASPQSSALEEIEGKIGGSARLSETLVNWFPVDEVGNYVGPRPFEMRLRVSPEVHFKGFGAVAEFDAATGAVAGNVPQTLIADRVPVPNFTPFELRQFYLQYRWQSGIFRIGQQTSQFGLGILANAGAQDAQAGDFGQQHFGNFVLRMLLAGRPFYSWGGNWRAFELYGALDLVTKDNNADITRGDRAFQAVLGVRLKADDERFAGFTFVYRRQRAAGVTDGGRATDAFVIDFAARWALLRREDRVLHLGLEMVGIGGTTTQIRTDLAPVAQLRQFGAAAKINYRFRSVGLLLDWGYASGDQNPYDDKLESFRFDRDYKVGLVLFDQVLGYQSARSGFRAADPMLTGQPPEGVTLLPSAGAVHGAWYLFPRIRYAITDWLDAYGGPLMAFSTAKLTDPFNTKVSGGTPVNYLGGKPGDYLGTELDLGLQARWQPHRLLTVTGVLEAGVLLPGDAFSTPKGTLMGPVGLGRLRLVLAL